ncbi:transposase, partial [Mariniflexile ostreae]
MGKKAEIHIRESVEDLKKLLQKQNTLKGEKRVKCLLKLKADKFETRQLLADHLGIHIRTLERWLSSYKLAG